MATFVAALGLTASASAAAEDHTHSEAGGTSLLQEQIAAADPGDTIVVTAGTYVGNLVIDVPIHLEGRGRPTIQGDGSGTVITVRAPGTTITGLRVTGSGPGPVGSPAGIRVEADEVTIEDNFVEDTYMGIAVMQAKQVDVVANTVIGRKSASAGFEEHATSDEDDAADSEHENHFPAGTGSGRLRGDAITLWNTEAVLVRGNTVRHARDGVYISFGEFTLVDSNQVADSRYALHTMFATDITVTANFFERNLSGAVLMYKGPALLLRNTMVDNRSPSTGIGVIVKDVVGVEIAENVIANNRVGIQLEGPSEGEEPTRVQLNTIALNEIGIMLPTSARGTFWANSIVDNLIQVGGHGIGSGRHVSWSERGFGNYWSNYRGHALEGVPDRGAVPHTEGSRVDGIIERSPILLALASSPGMRLIRSIESQRFAADPIVVDEVPLTRPFSPAFDTSGQTRSTGVLVTGIALTLLAGLAVARLLAPRPLPVRAPR